MLYILEEVTLLNMAVVIWIISFMVTYLAIPRIVSVLRHIKLLEKPNERSSHGKSIPSMGGIAFYLSFVSTMFFISLYLKVPLYSLALVFGGTVMFFMGIKDDIEIIRPQSKLISQIIVALGILFFSEFRITSESIFYIVSTPSWLLIAFSCFLILVIINAYNLIDGIDGLASMVGVVIFGVFGYLYYQLNDHFFFLLSLSSMAFLMAFLRYNLSKKHNKMFMGDTGTMIIGFIIAVLSLHFMSLGKESMKILCIISVQDKAMVLSSILFVPLLDLLRVFLLRLLKGKNPFLPDKRHLHHFLINKFHLSHISTSLLLSSVNFVVFALCYFLLTKVSCL